MIDYKWIDIHGTFDIGFKTTLGCDDSYISYSSFGNVVDDGKNTWSLDTGVEGNFTCEKW